LPPTLSSSLAWRRQYGEKTVRKAERAWFLSDGEESEAWIRVAFDSLGQKQRVFDLYCLSLFRETLLIFLLKLKRPLLE
jgi:hypothetical protein